MLFGRQSPRRRVLLIGVTAVILLGAILLGYRVIHHPARVVPAQDRPGAVILVPGYGGNADSLSALANRVRTTGRDTRVVSLPEGGTGDLHRQAAVVDQAVAAALRAGAVSVDVIGYSAGGVVARLWAQDYDGAHKARRIITLGSPHHGTDLASAGAAGVPGACPAACQQLAPGSQVLAALEVPVPRPPIWLSLWTTDDQTVTPPDSARLEGAINVPVQSLCPRLHVSHSELPTNEVVTDLVLQAIGPAPVTAAPAVSCPSS